jgi:hypothetical protein
VPWSFPSATPPGSGEGSPDSPAAITSGVFMPTMETWSVCVQRASASPLGAGSGGWASRIPATQL